MPTVTTPPRDHTHLQHVNISTSGAVAFVHLGHLFDLHIARVEEIDLSQFSVGRVAAALRQGIGDCWGIPIRVYVRVVKTKWCPDWCTHLCGGEERCEEEVRERCEEERVSEWGRED